MVIFLQLWCGSSVPVYIKICSIFPVMTTMKVKHGNSCGCWGILLHLTPHHSPAPRRNKKSRRLHRRRLRLRLGPKRMRLCHLRRQKRCCLVNQKKLAVSRLDHWLIQRSPLGPSLSGLTLEMSPFLMWPKMFVTTIMSVFGFPLTNDHFLVWLSFSGEWGVIYYKETTAIDLMSFLKNTQYIKCSQVY